jgi:hypothetical protein
LSLRRSLAIRLLTVAFAVAGVEGWAPQALRAWTDPSAEVAGSRAVVRPAAPSRPAPHRPIAVAPVVAPVPLVVGTRAWPPDSDVLALKHARLI